MERAREIYEYVRNIHLELNDWNSLSISQEVDGVNLDRFSQGLPDLQDKPEVILATCKFCGQEFIAGQEAVHDSLSDQYFCDIFCYCEWLIRDGGIEEVVLRSEDFDRRS